MWAHKALSDDDYSPDGECLYKSFVWTTNYWDACDTEGQWRLAQEYCGVYDGIRTVRQLKEALSQIDMTTTL